METQKETGNITRDGVARKAGVSSATVSRVFNNPSSVSPVMRDAVLNAARELGYQPNKAAGALRRKGTGTITLVEFGKAPRPYYWGALKSFDWFFAAAVRGVQQALSFNTWNFSVETIHSMSQLQEIARRSDGIIGYDIDILDEAQCLADLPVPTVIAHHVGNPPEFKDFLFAATDNHQGGIIQASWLLQRGCRRPVYITGWRSIVGSHKERYDGFMETFSKAGCEPVVIDIEVGRFGAVKNILPTVTKLCQDGIVDGIGAVNDMTLYEVLFGLRENGIVTPSETLPAVGYDAAPYFRFLNGPLASVDIGPEGIYRQAANLLVRKLGGEQVQSVMISPVLEVLENQKIVFV